ncbi:cold-shock protein [Reichenbachiella versicolor]|uniref:cold-shock protein n=1 Tax=Reichenbachiella versicolor TaxID=1821036 RepID=UPI000D6E6965|nr:cold shock domain-containing protein [Reichenbachiella versicolor]
MARSQKTFQKKEREKKKLQKRKGKEEKKALRKENSKSGSLDDMMVYVDENGNLIDTPPKEKDKTMEIDASQIDVSTPKSASDDIDAERRGKVKFYESSKGYGFIIQDGSNDEFYVHGTNVVGNIAENDKVKFKIEKSERGFVAINVSKIG